MNINALIAQYKLQTSWFLNALENITEEESNLPFSENLNPVKWVVGHLTDARFTLNAIISGNEINTDYKKLFGKGTSNNIDGSYPTLEAIMENWSTISDRLITHLQNISEEKLLSKPPFQTSIPDETLLGLIAYFAIHESFHIGQISVYRKLAAKPAMAMGKR